MKWFIKAWNWILKVIFRVTKAFKWTPETVGNLLDQGIEYFMRYYNKHMIVGQITAKGLLEKLEASILKKIESTETKFDDAIVPFIKVAFDQMDTVLVDRFVKNAKDNVQAALLDIKRQIILKYQNEENKH